MHYIYDSNRLLKQNYILIPKILVAGNTNYVLPSDGDLLFKIKDLQHLLDPKEWCLFHSI